MMFFHITHDVPTICDFPYLELTGEKKHLSKKNDDLLLGNFNHITVVYGKVLTKIKRTKVDYLQSNERYLEIKNIYKHELNLKLIKSYNCNTKKH